MYAKALESENAQTVSNNVSFRHIETAVTKSIAIKITTSYINFNFWPCSTNTKRLRGLTTNCVINHGAKRAARVPAIAQLLPNISEMIGRPNMASIKVGISPTANSHMLVRIKRVRI